MNRAANDNRHSRAAADARSAATFIDGLVVVLCLPLAVPVSMAMDALGASGWVGLVAVTLAWCLSAVAVLAAFEASSLMATPGKLACGLRVTAADGSRVRYPQAFLRNLTKYGWSVVGLGIVAASGWAPGGSLHDRRAGTTVTGRDGGAQ